MASTINADNGVVSGSSGVKTTADTSGVLALQSNGSTGVTLDTSLNVGIGTTSPVPYGGFKSLTLNGSTGGLIQLQSNGTSTGRFYAPSTTNTVIDTLAGDLTVYATGSLFLGTGSATKATLDTAGNLGLNVTPSAWGSNYKAMQFGAQGSIHTYVGVSMSMAANAYDSGAGAWKYIANNYACRFTQDPSNGQSVWQNAPLGTAGAALTWTTSLSINNSGAIGVGSSPSYGTSGQVLTSGGSGAAPTWSTPSAGAVSLVSSVTASGATDVSFTGLTDTPAYYFIEFDGVYGSVGGTFGCNLSVDNGASYITSNYRYAFLWAGTNDGSTPFATVTSAGTRIVLANIGVSTVVDYPARGIVRVLGAATVRAAVQYELTVISSTPHVGHSTGSAATTSTSGVNAIKFAFSSGTISGNFRLYSVSKT